jgi:hypothetical protein
LEAPKTIMVATSIHRTKARERVGMAGHSCDRCNGGFLGLGRREPRGVFTIGGELNRKKEATKPERLAVASGCQKTP